MRMSQSEPIVMFEKIYDPSLNNFEFTWKKVRYIKGMVWMISYNAITIINTFLHYNKKLMYTVYTV